MFVKNYVQQLHSLCYIINQFCSSLSSYLLPTHCKQHQKLKVHMDVCLTLNTFICQSKNQNHAKEKTTIKKCPKCWRGEMPQNRQRTCTKL